MSDMTHVIDTSGVVSAMMRNLNDCDQMNFINMLFDAAENAHNELDVRVTNEINVLKQQITSITNNNSVLNDLQLGDIESILVRLINTEGMQNVLNNACVNVGNQRYTISSVVEALANAPAIGSWTLPDMSGDCLLPENFTITLSNGVSQIFNTVQTAQDGNLRTFRFTTDNFNNTGLQAGFDMVMSAKKIEFTRFKSPVHRWKRDVIKQENVMVDLGSTLTLCGNMNTDVDLNNDGIIGRPDIVIDDPVDPPVTIQPAPQLKVQRSVIAIHPDGSETIGYVDTSTGTTYETFPEGAILVDHNGVPVPVSTTETSSDTTSSSTTTTTTTTTTSSGDGTDFSDVLGDPNAGATGN